MSKIDPTARVEDGAVIGEGTEIGPFCIIGRNARIGANCKLIGQVTVIGHTSVGDDCVISPFAVLGGAPQDLSYKGEPTTLDIGSGCTIREGATMNVGTVKGGGHTRVGNDGYFMNNSHVGHDCMVGNNAIFATSATLGGHCEIGDAVYIGGLSAVHQFTRIGSYVMVGGLSGVRDDIIPLRARQRPICGAGEPQSHRHEAAQVHQAAPRNRACVLPKTLPWPRHLRRAAGGGAAP